jgi:hypothetical protein
LSGDTARSTERCMEYPMEQSCRRGAYSISDLEVQGGCAMRNTGDRYTCSDSSCGCEVEVRNPGRQAKGDAGPEFSVDSPNESFDPGSLRRAETEAISTPGDYGSQGATGEGLFGTSGGGGSSMMSGRYGSKIMHESDSHSTPSDRTVASDSEIRSFSCFCGKPMRRTSVSEQTPSRRTATA